MKFISAIYSISMAGNKNRKISLLPKFLLRLVLLTVMVQGFTPHKVAGKNNE